MSPEDASGRCCVSLCTSTILYRWLWVQTWPAPSQKTGLMRSPSHVGLNCRRISVSYAEVAGIHQVYRRRAVRSKEESVLSQGAGAGRQAGSWFPQVPFQERS